MSSKIQAYLKDTDPTGRYMRDVLGFYITGKMRSFLLKQHITKLEIFPSIRKGEGSLQINFQYYNLYVILDFDEAGYEYSVYTKNGSASDLENSIVQQSYSSDFSIESFLDAFMRLLNSDAHLIKTNRTIEKNKLYKCISSICLGFSILIILVPGVCGLITGNVLQFGRWYFGIAEKPSHKNLLEKI